MSRQSDAVKFAFDRSRESASVVVPLVLELCETASVLDVGCGDGSWLSSFVANGVNDVFGVDASLAPEPLLDPARLKQVDLEQPLKLERRFDLVLCLEVAEHLPASAAQTLIESLCRHADVVLFSAAVPGQGGHGHINEQWPEYWAELFASRGFLVLDVVRPRVWSDPRVMYWYAQNILLFVRADKLAGQPQMIAAREGVVPPLSMVHPRQFEVATAPRPWWVHVKAALRALLRRG